MTEVATPVSPKVTAPAKAAPEKPIPKDARKPDDKFKMLTYGGASAKDLTPFSSGDIVTRKQIEDRGIDVDDWLKSEAIERVRD